MGIYIDVFDTITYEKMFPVIKNVGFDGFFSGQYWANDKNKMAYYNRLAKEYGLLQETSHSTIPGCECIWSDTAAGDNYKEVLFNNINICKSVSVDTLVVHIQTVKDADLESGLARLTEVVDYATEEGIKLAFKNINNPEFLYSTLDRFKNSNVGFCYDCGHEECYCANENYLEKIGDRLFCTHMHDNNSEADSHFIPFDGNIDFEKIAKQLKACKYKGNITLELSYINAGNNMPYEDFFKKAHTAALKLQEMIF